MVFTGPTIVDVMESHLGGLNPEAARTLNQNELDEVAEAVADFYDLWSPDPDPGALLAYSGEAIGMTAPNGVPALSSLRASLIYHPSIAIHCPLGSYFTRDAGALTIPAGPRLKRGDLWVDVSEYRLVNTYFKSKPPLEDGRTALRSQLAVLESIRPLIQTGIVIPVPPWKIVRERQKQIEAAMRADIASDDFIEMLADPEFMVRFQDLIYGGRSQVQLPQRLSQHDKRLLIAEAPSFYQNKMLAIGDALGAVYIPPSENEYQLLAPRLSQLREELRVKSRIEMTIARDILRTDLPLFSKVSVATLVKIRQDEEAFEEFRQVLTTVYRSASASPEDPNFPDDLRVTVEDALAPRVNEIRAATARSTTLKNASGVGATELVVGAVGGAAAGGGQLGPILLGAGISGISAGLLRMLSRPKLQGANLVISALISPNAS